MECLKLWGAAHRGGLPVPEHLTADAQALNQVLVSFRVTAFQVFQKAAASRDHRQQSPAGMMIFAVRLEMILELQNTLAQDRYLHFWRTGIGLVNSICCNYLLFWNPSPVPFSNRYSSSFLNLFCPSQDSTDRRRGSKTGSRPHQNQGNCVTLGVFGFVPVCFSQPSIRGDSL